MTKTALYDALNYVNSSRENRGIMANKVLHNPELFGPLMEIAFEDSDPISSKACWILEFAAKQDLEIILPHIDLFMTNMDKVKLDSSVRPLAKVCECLTLAYFSEQKNEVQKALKDAHLEKMTTACFDWLIGTHKVAPQAYSMTCLLLLGNKYKWVHPELQLVLEQNFNNGSAAYKARARHVLGELKKLEVRG